MMDALIIGGGPAGLMAAEQLSAAGHSVLVAEAKPSLGRKLLMAGKSGLNLTKDAPLQAFQDTFHPVQPMARYLQAFGPEQVKSWAQGLGQKVFTGSSGRVFPKSMKASPLLRAWIGRLSGQGVAFQTRWRWVGWDGSVAVFDTPDGRQTVESHVTVLALGGASWARLGSDGAWAHVLASEGVKLAPFQPANMGVSMGWSDHMSRHFGAPVKNVALIAGTVRARSEFVISKRGIEGGGVYAVSRAVREGAELQLDLLPTRSLKEVTGLLSRPRGKMSISNFLRRTLKLGPVKTALLMEFGRPLPEGEQLAHLLKALPVRHSGPRPIDEAISVAGGVAWQALSDDLMLHARPNVFCAGEMLDWEAPTGGYLLTGCLATGRWAGQAASTVL